MKIIFLAALLSVVQAAPPVPRKAPNSTASRSQNVQNDATGKQRPAAPSPVVGPVTSPKDQNSAGEPTKTNAQETVAIREPVPVSIGKDWWDRAYIVFTGLLVLIGGIGIMAALQTLKIIRRQAVSMRRQTTILRNSVNAVISENRPWLLIPSGQNEAAIQEPFLEPVEQNMWNRMAHCIFFTKNYGSTPGQIFASKAELQIGDSPSTPPDPSVYDMNKVEHTVITFPPGESVASEALLAPLAFIKAENRDQVLHGGKYLWLCGFLRYRDTFERENAPEHETRFCYLYETRFNSPKPFWKIAGPSIYTRAT